MDNDEIIKEVEELGLEVCSNYDRLKFELHKAEQELAIIGLKKEFFNNFPQHFLKTKYGTFISATDKEHSPHAQHAVEQRIMQLKKEIRKEKTKLALVENTNDYFVEERHLSLVPCLNSL